MTAGWDADKLVADAKEQLRQGDARLATAYATVAIAYATVAIAEAIVTHLSAAASPTLAPALDPECRTETSGFCRDRWGARGHLCSLDSEHDGGHECACGHRWREVDE
jgi:hypothetical protein